jgi:hypothetical protein
MEQAVLYEQGIGCFAFSIIQRSSFRDRHSDPACACRVICVKGATQKFPIASLWEKLSWLSIGPSFNSLFLTLTSRCLKQTLHHGFHLLALSSKEAEKCIYKGTNLYFEPRNLTASLWVQPHGHHPHKQYHCA